MEWEVKSETGNSSAVVTQEARRSFVASCRAIVGFGVLLRREESASEGASKAVEERFGRGFSVVAAGTVEKSVASNPNCCVRSVARLYRHGGMIQESGKPRASEKAGRVAAW